MHVMEMPLNMIEKEKYKQFPEHFVLCDHICVQIYVYIKELKIFSNLTSSLWGLGSAKG